MGIGFSGIQDTVTSKFTKFVKNNKSIFNKYTLLSYPPPLYFIDFQDVAFFKHIYKFKSPITEFLTTIMRDYYTVNIQKLFPQQKFFTWAEGVSLGKIVHLAEGFQGDGIALGYVAEGFTF